MYIDVNFA